MRTDSFSGVTKKAPWSGSRSCLLAALGLLILGCESKNEVAPFHTEPSTFISVGAPGPGLVTNYNDKPTISWPSPSFDLSKRTVPDEELREVAVKLASVVEWPSGKVVPGKWTTPEGAPNQIAFEREGEPSGSWEAVVLDAAKMPKEFGGAGHVGPPVVYSPVSRPIVVSVYATRVVEDDDGKTSGAPPREKGNDLLGITLSEEVEFGSLSDAPMALRNVVEVESEAAETIACKPSWNFEGMPGPALKGLLLECPSLGEALKIRIKSSIKSSAGASLAESYSLSGDEDVTIEVMLPGPDPKEPATPREADKNSLLEQAGVPKAQEKAP